MNSIRNIIVTFASGNPIIVMDDKDRENEGDLMIAGLLITSKQMAFMVRNTTGIICAATTHEHAMKLDLQPMVLKNTDVRQTLFTVSVDSNMTTTGVSASDRALTLRTLAKSDSTSKSFRRPGHIFPLISRGIQNRKGHTEAGVALCHITGLPPIACISELVNDDGSMSRITDCQKFSNKYNIPLCSVDDIFNYFQRIKLISPEIKPVPQLKNAINLKIGSQDNEIHTHVQLFYKLGVQHIVVQYGNSDCEIPSVRVHSECLPGDVWGCTHCDCRLQLKSFLNAKYERGILIYMRQHEGCGIGLKSKLEAYELQSQGMNTVDANKCLGYAADERDFNDAKQILESMNISKIRLHTNNPLKIKALETLIDSTHRIRKDHYGDVSGFDDL